MKHFYVDLTSLYMASTSGVAVFDVGKTNLKLIVFGLNGSILEIRQKKNRTVNKTPFPHINTSGIWDWFIQALAGLCRTFRIRTIVVTTHGAAAALVDDEGKLVLPVLDYEYPGIENCSADYFAVKPEFNETYSPSLPNGLNLGKQLFWLQTHFPDEFKQATSLLCYPQYWTWRLCDRQASEVTSLGCHTDLWNPVTQAYSSLVEKQGWQRQFPPMQSAGTVLGSLTEDVRRRIGITYDCQVLTGLHDSNASFYRHRKQRTEKFSMVSTGTWVICMASDQNLEILNPKQDTLANVDVYGTPVACSRFMGGRELEEIAGKDHIRDIVGTEDILNLLESSVYILPTFAGNSGPFPAKTGTIVGTCESKSSKAMAVLYCALMTDYCLSLIHAEGDLILEGNFTTDPMFSRLIATLRPFQTVYISECNNGTAEGAFALTAWGSNLAVPEQKVNTLDFADLLKDYQKTWETLCLGPRMRPMIPPPRYI